MPDEQRTVPVRSCIRLDYILRASSTAKCVEYLFDHVYVVGVASAYLVVNLLPLHTPLLFFDPFQLHTAWVSSGGLYDLPPCFMAHKPVRPLFYLHIAQVSVC